jgi:hypothetical protein
MLLGDESKEYQQKLFKVIMPKTHAEISVEK